MRSFYLCRTEQLISHGVRGQPRLHRARHRAATEPALCHVCVRRDAASSRDELVLLIMANALSFPDWPGAWVAVCWLVCRRARQLFQETVCGLPPELRWLVARSDCCNCVNCVCLVSILEMNAFTVRRFEHQSVLVHALTRCQKGSANRVGTPSLRSAAVRSL